MFYLIGSLHAEHFSSLPGLSVNAVLFCPKCGKEWARVWSTTVKEWRAFNASCDHCAPFPLEESIPGSLLTVVGSTALDFLPPAILKWEFLKAAQCRLTPNPLFED